MAELLPLTPDELLTTTRAVRKRLDLTRPVPKELILECLEIAVQAPTGSNRQGWQWLFVDDPEKKRALAALYAEVFDEYASGTPVSSTYVGDTRAERRDRVNESARYLRDHFHEVPVLLLPYYEGRRDGQPAASQAGFWGSICPAVWSFMLALRARGLGSAWTTMTCRREVEVAELLGVPHEQYTQIGMFPIAYTIGTDFRQAPRMELSSIFHWNSW